MTNQASWRQNKRIILSAALAAAGALALAHPVSAQYAAGGDGHAHDANARVGSGGYNTGGASGSSINGNNIANRDVNGGRGFTGPMSIFERDGQAFSGRTAFSPSDSFNRQSNTPTNSTGVPQSTGRPQQYYGDSRFAPPPAGSLPLGFNGGYVNDNPNTPSSLSSGFNMASDAGTLSARTMNPQTLLLNRATNSSDAATVLSKLDQNGALNLSPVYGLRTSDTGTGAFNSLGLPDRASADQLATFRMQQELRDSSVNPGDNNPNGIGAKNPNGVQPVQTAPNGTVPPVGLNDPINNRVGTGFDTPSNGAISNRVTSSELPSNQLSSTGIISGKPGEIPSAIPPAEQQSPLLKILQNRLAESGGVGKALAENQPLPTARPQPKPVPNDNHAIVAPAESDKGPVPVSSFAVGIKAKGLHDLLAGAEELVRQGKFDSAIEKYDLAQRVAPNNPLPELGRAQAELAGGYYAKAETDLRAVFRSNPELLMMRFDLKLLFPKDRLAFVSKDLHDLATSDPKVERPWFVLAYLDYNTGDAAAAENDLNEAEQRSGHGDWSVRLLKQHWALPTKPAAQPAPAPAPTVTPSAAPTPAPALNK